jgi:hypothetical protein
MASIPAQPGNLASFPETRVHASEKTAAIPWYIWCATVAATSATIGGYWDISWHESIGRDTFWTPAHMAIYLCGVLAGIAFGYLILHTTFAKNSPLAASSVHIFGFCAPLGAFIASWGGIAMLTSAPFDNWWHAAYGIDVKIVSPPHILLIAGVYGVVIGTLVLLAGHMNRSESSHAAGNRLILYINGIMLVQIMILLMESTERVYLHSLLPYIVTAALPPIVLALSSRLTGFRFAATSVTAFYMLFRIGLILLLPLFPAEPKLGPVYQQVTHFIPPDFPLLLIVPAFALDLLWQRTRSWNPWKMAALSGFIWVSLFLAVEWPFASFLMSPASRNWFFGTSYFFYALPPTSFMARNVFYPSNLTPFEFSLGLLCAVMVGTLAFRWGIARGEWLGKIKR